MNALLLLLSLLFSPSLVDEPALRGLDPVALCHGDEVPGDQAIEERWGSYVYRFVDESTRELFRQDPERYCIQWDGGCGRMGPLSGKGSPQRWAVHDERIYVFASDGCRKGFLSDPKRYLPAPAEPVQGTPEARAEGARLLARAREVHGGAALDRESFMVLRERGETSGWKREHELILSRLGAIERRMSWTPPAGQGERSLDRWVLGEGADFAVRGGAAYELTSPHAREDVLRFAHREPLTHLWAAGTEGLVALDLGPGKLGDQATRDLFVRHRSLSTVLHLSPSSGLILGLSWEGRPNDGLTRKVVERFTAWEELQGVKLPKARDVLVDGKESESLARAWSQASLSAELPAGAFDRPK